MKYIEKLTKKKLGEILIAEGLITKEQLDLALEEQQKRGDMLGEVLVSMKLIPEADIAKAVARRFQLPFICPSKYSISKEVLDILPPSFLRANRIVPLDIFGDTLAVASYVIPSMKVLEEIKKETGYELFIYISNQSEIKAVLNTLIPEQGEEDSGWESIFDLGNEEVIKELKK